MRRIVDRDSHDVVVDKTTGAADVPIVVTIILSDISIRVVAIIDDRTPQRTRVPVRGTEMV